MKLKHRSPTDRRPRTTWTLTLRLTEDQRAEIVREATEKGISLSDVVRARIFGPDGSPDCMPGGRRLMNTEGELEA